MAHSYKDGTPCIDCGDLDGCHLKRPCDLVEAFEKYNKQLTALMVNAAYENSSAEMKRKEIALIRFLSVNMDCKLQDVYLAIENDANGVTRWEWRRRDKEICT